MKPLLLTVLCGILVQSSAWAAPQWSVKVVFTKHGDKRTLQWDAFSRRGQPAELRFREGMYPAQYRVLERPQAESLRDRISGMTLRMMKLAKAGKCDSYLELKGTFGNKKVCEQDFLSDFDVRTLLSDLQRLM